MPEYQRMFIPGGTIFFTVASGNRRPVLCRDDVRMALRNAIGYCRERFPFAIDAWVLLPDHLHCIWTLPPGDADFGKRWSIIKRKVTQQCRHLTHTNEITPSKQKRRESSLWQRRFWEHQIRDERDYTNHVNYIHFNPVKHGHVTQPADWPWSTFHRDVQRGLYPVNWNNSSSTKECEGIYDV